MAGSEPDRIVVQHVLIGFAGSIPGQPISRSRDDAKTLAEQILAKAQAGESFDDLVKTHTDDSFPGRYGMANDGVAADRARSEYPRRGMVPAFGNVGFTLAVGEVGMAPHHPQDSPYGWHVIKRVA